MKNKIVPKQFQKEIEIIQKKTEIIKSGKIKIIWPVTNEIINIMTVCVIEEGSFIKYVCVCVFFIFFFYI